MATGCACPFQTIAAESSGAAAGRIAGKSRAAAAAPRMTEKSAAACEPDVRRTDQV
jgi:hypothetical protein